MEIGGDTLSICEVQFGLHLLSQLVTTSPGRNVIVSPLGLFQALSLYAFHGMEAARAQMRKALGIATHNDASLHSMYRQLGQRLQFQSAETQLRHATTLWTGSAIPLDDSVAKLAEQWGITVFSGGDVTSERMQRWAQEQTAGLLSASINPPSINTANLMNALYFHGKWASCFDRKNTQERLFYQSAGLPKRTPLMRQSETTAVSLYRNNKFTAARIPYLCDTEHAIALHILLPQRNVLTAFTGTDSITPFMERFTHGDWDSCQANYSESVVDLILPRFTFRQTHALRPVLQQMGMRKAFELPALQTSSLLPIIDRVQQQIYASVDEAGTTATALTEIAFIIAPLHSEEPERPRREKFYVNRPFIFLLTEETSGLLLFAGVIHDPTA